MNTAEDFIRAMGAAATGVSVLTTDGLSGKFGLTVSAMSSVSAEPPMLLACVNRKSPAVAAIDGNGHFAVSVLDEASHEVAETFAGRSRSGRNFDFDLHAWREGPHGLPLLASAAAIFECRTEQAVDAGTHRIYIGLVTSAARSTARPLVYCDRRFARIVPF